VPIKESLLDLGVAAAELMNDNIRPAAVAIAVVGSDLRSARSRGRDVADGVKHLLISAGLRLGILADQPVHFPGNLRRNDQARDKLASHRL